MPLGRLPALCAHLFNRIASTAARCWPICLSMWWKYPAGNAMSRCLWHLGKSEKPQCLICHHLGTPRALPLPRQWRSAQFLRVHYSRSMEEAYRANTCGSCGTFVGNTTYLTRQWTQLYETSEPHSTIRPARTFGLCPTCSPHKPMTPTDVEIQQAREESDDRFRAWRQERE